ncbi:hypothetical protein [Pontibacter diazotrophicus]|nr:hypothetical protein [Pontibacter diazotrophicus]
MANISWEQNFKDSLIETTPYLLWMLFFYLLYIRIPIRILENIIIIYGILYIVLYFIQLSNSHNVLFGKPISGGDEFTEQRGMTRIIFPGGGIFILSIFIALNKLTTKVKNLWFWLLITCLGLLIPILQVTRQFIAGIMLIYLYHFTQSISLFKKTFLLLLFGGIVITASYVEHPILQGLIETQERDANLGENYIRVLAGNYFMTDFSPNTLSKIFGNGVPNWGISDYGIFVEILAHEQEYYLSDVGIIAVYAMFGIISILGYIIIWIKSFTIPLPKEYYYLKYYLWFLLFTSFTWFTVYHYHYMISTVFVLYIYQHLYEGQENYAKTIAEESKPFIVNN